MNLYKDFNMGPVFINGLIFELELALQVEVENEITMEMTEPVQLITNLFENEKFPWVKMWSRGISKEQQALDYGSCFFRRRIFLYGQILR